MKEEAVVVFTARSPDHIVMEGGSQAWVLNAAHAKRCTWLVCTQNRNYQDHELSDATEPHGSAFLIGRVSGVKGTDEESKDGKKRWCVTISEFARIDVADFWCYRNPVRYMTRAELERKGIDFGTLEFRPIQPQAAAQSASARTAAPVPSTLTGQSTTFDGVRSLTIAEARQGLAATFGVKPDAIEITIRG